MKNFISYLLSIKKTFFGIIILLFALLCPIMIFANAASIRVMILERENCNSCGLCIAHAPNIFRFAKDGKAEVYNPLPGDTFYDAVDLAREECPLQLIYMNR